MGGTLMLTISQLLLLILIGPLLATVILVRQGPRHPQVCLMVSKAQPEEYRLPTFIDQDGLPHPLRGLKQELKFEFEDDDMVRYKVEYKGRQFYIMHSKRMWFEQDPKKSYKVLEAGWFPLAAFLDGSIKFKHFQLHPNIGEVLKIKKITDQLEYFFPAAGQTPILPLRFGPYGQPEILLAGKSKKIAKYSESLEKYFKESNATKCSMRQIGSKGPVTFGLVCRASPEVHDGSLKHVGDIDGTGYSWQQFDFGGLNSLLQSWYIEIGSQPMIQGDFSQIIKDFDLLPTSRPLRSDGKPSTHGSLSRMAVLRASVDFVSDNRTFPKQLKSEILNSLQQSERMTLDEQHRPNSSRYITEYSTVPCDTLAAAMDILDEDPSQHVMIVNFANNKVPGGGYQLGTPAQEEDIFRCSTLPWTLGKLAGDQSFYPINSLIVQDQEHVPSTVKAIFTPNCRILRQRTDWKFLNLEYILKYKVSVCSIAAYNQNDTEERSAAFHQSRLNHYGYLSTLNRVRTMFQMAETKGATTLILGAFGCGAYKNDPKQIIAMFNDVMAEYDGALRHVIFAIIGENWDIFTHPETGLQFPRLF